VLDNAGAYLGAVLCLGKVHVTRKKSRRAELHDVSLDPHSLMGRCLDQVEYGASDSVDIPVMQSITVNYSVYDVHSIPSVSYAPTACRLSRIDLVGRK
jgi:hypothetical protein